LIIIWVNKRNWKYPGPIVNVAVHNAAAYAKLGYETHFCIGAGDPSDTQKDLEDFYGLPVRSNFTIHRIPRRKIGKRSYSQSIFKYAFTLARKLASKDQVAVISRETSFLWPLARLCRHPGIQGYYEMHDFNADLSWMTGRKGTNRHRKKILERLFIPYIDGLIAITQKQQHLYRQVFPKIPSVSFPLGTKLRSPQDPEKKRMRRTLMYVGHMHGDKGVDFLFQTAAALADEKIKTVFWGGNESKLNGLRNNVKQLGLSEFVRFVGFQPPEKMHQAMAQEASLGVVMLRDTFYNRYLTCPVKALDYLSHGLPSIGSDLPAVQEVLGSAGLYIRPDDTRQFTQKVLMILNDPEHYKKKAALAVQRAKEISWENRAATICEFIKKTG
jgi:glycosyltransferase involved in cell wall biosynthesis